MKTYSGLLLTTTIVNGEAEYAFKPIQYRYFGDEPYSIPGRLGVRTLMPTYDRFHWGL